MNEEKDIFILIDESTTFDLNWIYCRRKINAFTQLLKDIILSYKMIKLEGVK